MLRMLNHRWLGVSCWVYLLALTFAVLMYWILPTSSAVRTWTFDGRVRFEGFTSDHQRLVITRLRSNRAVFDHLDLATGQCTTYLPLQHPDHALDYQALMKKPSTLTLTPLDGQGEIILNKADSSRQVISCDCRHLVINELPVGGVGSITLPINLSGYSGMSSICDSERWLIMTRRYAEVWQPLLQWAKRTFDWSPSYLSDGWRYSAAIIDLNTNQEIACPLSTHNQPQYAINPDGSGFAVFDERVIGLNPVNAAKLCISTISWYTLPLGPARHSINQWGLIVLTFCVPVFLAILMNLLRRKPREKVTAG